MDKQQKATDFPLIFHMPGLHPTEENVGLLRNVLFFSPGLPRTENAPFYVSSLLPFSPQVAQACLHDMIAFGEQVRHARDLAAVTLEVDQQKEDTSRLKQELADIAHFEVTGDAQGGVQNDTDVVDTVQASAESAQKALILAWNLEERVAELAELEKKLSGTRAVLDDLISGDPDFAIADAKDISVALPGLEDVAGNLSGMGETVSCLSWKTVLDAMLRLAPSDSAFETDDPKVISTLGEVAKPLPVEGLTGMVYSRIEAWKMLGHTRAPEQRPWLDRAVTIYFSVADAKAAGLKI